MKWVKAGQLNNQQNRELNITERAKFSSVRFTALQKTNLKQ